MADTSSSDVEALVMYPDAPQRSARVAYSQSSCMVSTRTDTAGLMTLLCDIRSMPGGPPHVRPRIWYIYLPQGVFFDLGVKSVPIRASVPRNWAAALAHG